MPRIKRHIGEVRLIHKGRICRNNIFDTIAELKDVLSKWSMHIYPAIRRGDKVSIKVDFYKRPKIHMELEEGEWVGEVKEVPTVGKKKTNGR